VIFVPQKFLLRVNEEAKTAYPRECCGLFAGLPEDKNGDIAVTRMRASRNIAEDDRHDRFEIDPETRFELMRDIGEFDRIDGNAQGEERIIGHYHSHPDHPARPSAYDLEMAFEADLFWMIVSVEDGQATTTSIHRLDATRQQFREVAFTAGEI